LDGALFDWAGQTSQQRANRDQCRALLDYGRLGLCRQGRHSSSFTQAPAQPAFRS